MKLRKTARSIFSSPQLNRRPNNKFFLAMSTAGLSSVLYNRKKADLTGCCFK